MNVIFENGPVPIYRLRKGVVVFWLDSYYHIQSIYTNNEYVTLVLENAHEVDAHVDAINVTWLEPF